MTDATYTVPGMSCQHCVQAVTTELGRLPGVDSVVVDLEMKLVTVHGDPLEDASLRAAIVEAGYEAQ
ncbi:MAG: heavy metal-associated domain-containing protein [Actinomycetes bacterium]